jgi:hypothetical protein
VTTAHLVVVVLPGPPPHASPAGVATNAVSGLTGFGIDAIFSGLAQWVVGGATWLLDQIGGVLSATTAIDVGAGWFTNRYAAMAALAGVLVLPLLLAAVVQAVLRQSPALLVRSVLVHLPLALLLTGAAVQVVQLALAATDAMSSAVASSAGQSIQRGLDGVAAGMVQTGGVGLPAFVLLLGSLFVAFGAFLLWIEMLVRAAAVYVAVLFLPLALASLVWPAIAHWCRRLVETLAALILSKFVIVAILALAVGALSSGTAGSGSSGAGFASVLGGGALLFLAAATPFTLLRLIPIAEAGAVHQLEGASHRTRQVAGAVPKTAAALALGHLGGDPLAGLGTGTSLSEPLEPPGTHPLGSLAGPAPGRRGGRARRGRDRAGPETPDGRGFLGIPDAVGDAEATAAALARLERLKASSDEEPPPSPSPWVWPDALGTVLSGPGRPGPPPDRGHTVIDTDAMGPVIRWIPPGEEGDEDEVDAEGPW